MLASFLGVLPILTPSLCLSLYFKDISDLLHTIIVSEFSEFYYIFTFTNEFYTFMCFHIIISIIFFYLQEFPLAFL
jgi:hypothetical protein